MDDRSRTRRALPAALLAVLLGFGAEPAQADLTVFAGSTTPAARTAGGAALGLSLEPVGLEFEYARTAADRAAAGPALQTGLFNLLAGASFGPGRRIRVYGSVGGGAYRERLAEHVRTNLAASAGGGASFRLTGPFRIRVDYRLLALRGAALHRRPRRAYAGLAVAF